MQVKIKKQTFVFVLCMIFFCCSCSPTKTLTEWDIVITSPHGETKRYTVHSYEKPIPSTQWGGQTRVIDRGNSYYHDWEKDIVAPVGWMLTVEEKK